MTRRCRRRQRARGLRTRPETGYPHPHGKPAVLFDIDGTLVDSNYLHVHAWQQPSTRSACRFRPGMSTARSAWTGPPGRGTVRRRRRRCAEAAQGLPHPPLRGLRRSADHAARGRADCCSVLPTWACRSCWRPQRRRTNWPCCAQRSTATSRVGHHLVRRRRGGQPPAPTSSTSH